MSGHLEPLGMLVEHRVHDMNKWLVTGKKAWPASEKIALKPALAKVLTQHFHHTAIRRNMFVGFQNLAGEGPAGNIKACGQAIGFRLVRAKQPEVSRLLTTFKHI